MLKYPLTNFLYAIDILSIYKVSYIPLMLIISNCFLQADKCQGSSSSCKLISILLSKHSKLFLYLLTVK